MPLLFTTYIELDTGEEGGIRAACHLIVNSLSSFVLKEGQSASVAIRLLERTIIFSSSCVGIAATLNQDRTAIDHNGLAGAESFLHQEQIGLRDVMSFADSPHRQTLARAFKELLPF